LKEDGGCLNDAENIQNYNHTVLDTIQFNLGNLDTFWSKMCML